MVVQPVSSRIDFQDDILRSPEPRKAPRSVRTVERLAAQDRLRRDVGYIAFRLASGLDLVETLGMHINLELSTMNLIISTVVNL